MELVRLLNQIFSRTSWKRINNSIFDRSNLKDYFLLLILFNKFIEAESKLRAKGNVFLKTDNRKYNRLFSSDVVPEVERFAVVCLSLGMLLPCSSTH